MSSSNYTHDNSSEESRFSKRDDESLYSTSSMFSTTSRLSKIPNAVRTSVKHILTRDLRLKDCVKHIRKSQQILDKHNLFQKAHRLTLEGDRQVKKASILHQLAHKEYPKTMPDLYARLIHDCEDISSNTEHKKFPREALLFILSGIRDMMEMSVWEKNEMENSIEQTEAQIRKVDTKRDNVIKAVYDNINEMKQLMNECACQYYKAEKIMIVPFKGYKIEETSQDVVMSERVEHMDKEGRWYRDYFMNNPTACHFLGYKDNCPLLISAVVEYVDNKKYYRLIYRRQKTKAERKIIPDSFLLNAPPCSTCDTMNDILDTTWKTVIETNFDEPFHLFRKMTDDVLIKNNLDQELLKADECALQKEYKFGVLLIKDNQTREEEWLGNEHDSPLFEEFLNVIGNCQDLRGYDGYTGKLGTECETTFVNTWHEHVVAYHVSTLIPSTPDDKQQVARKKYIGNDIVCIVFVEGNQPFNPSAITSQMQHVFIVVRQEELHSKKVWRVQVVTAEDVPPFGPPLPEFFEDSEDLSQFMLAKLINAEYAALKAPKLVHMTTIAGEQLLPYIVEKGWKILDDIERTSCSDTCSTTSSSNCSCQSLNGKKRSHIKGTSSISSFSTQSIKSSTITTTESVKPSSSYSCIEKPEKKRDSSEVVLQQSLKQKFLTSLRKTQKEA